MGRTLNLTIPLQEKDVRDLQLNDVVYLSGSIYIMMFQNQFSRFLQALDKGDTSDVDLRDGVLYHTGTIYHKNSDGSLDFRGIGATTSMKFNDVTPEIIKKAGVRAIIGKGGMDDKVLNTMKECGCVYLSVVGGCSAIYTPKVIGIEKEIWPQKSWSKNVLKIKVDHFGPMFVAMDAHGHSVFDEVKKTAEENKDKIFQALAIR